MRPGVRRSRSYQKSGMDAGASGFLRLIRAFAERQPNPASCLCELCGSSAEFLVRDLDCTSCGELQLRTLINTVSPIMGRGTSQHWLSGHESVR